MMFKLTATLVCLSFMTAPAVADEVRGTVSKVDIDKHELVIQARSRAVRGLNLTFTLTSDTQVSLGKRPAAAADLQPGQRALVLYETRDGKRIALGVTVSGGSRPAAAAAPTGGSVGTLLRISPADREIIIVGTGPKGEKDFESTFSVAPTTAITRDGKAIKFEDLKDGESVTVHAERKAGKLTAVSIQAGVALAPSYQAAAPRGERLKQLLRVGQTILQQLGSRKETPTDQPKDSPKP
jgi:hypothetical protein